MFSLVHFGPELGLGGHIPLNGKGMPLLPILNGFQSFSEEGGEGRGHFRSKKIHEENGLGQ